MRLQSLLFAHSYRRRPGETKINIYGDMGVYAYNNMKELAADCNAEAGTSVRDPTNMDYSPTRWP